MNSIRRTATAPLGALPSVPIPSLEMMKEMPTQAQSQMIPFRHFADLLVSALLWYSVVARDEGLAPSFFLPSTAQALIEGVSQRKEAGERA